MDNENVVQIYTLWTLSTSTENDIMKIGGKWLELEKITLSEVVKTQKDNHHFFSLETLSSKSSDVSS